MSFRIAIIGRPNVGKSTLFNRLSGKKLALVDDQPGVTRDRREGRGKLGDLSFTIIDTAGLEESGRESLSGRMRAQTEAAILDSDAIFFVVDARAGLTAADRHFAQLVRRADKPMILIANKAEGKLSENALNEAYELGLGDPVALSAEHGEGFGELFSAVLQALPERTAAPVESETIKEEWGADDFEEEDGSECDVSRPLKIAVVGRPNAGKSTLLNKIYGQERLLVGPEAGVTRDSICIKTTWMNRELHFFDTAGLRKRANVQEKLEKLANADALRAVRFAEVVVLLLDAMVPLEKQDLTIADLVEREGRALVIAINKWDLIANSAETLTEISQKVERLLPQLKHCPVIAVSGKSGFGLDRLMQAIFSAEVTWNKRISTGKLNRWLGKIVEQTPPPAISGRRIKIRYMTQPKARPPFFVLFGNQLDDLPTSYKRFLVNNIRQSFDLPGVPVRISVRQTNNPYRRSK